MGRKKKVTKLQSKKGTGKGKAKEDKVIFRRTQQPKAYKPEADMSTAQLQEITGASYVFNAKDKTTGRWFVFREDKNSARKEVQDMVKEQKDQLVLAGDGK